VTNGAGRTVIARIFVGRVFLTEDIQKLLFPAALGPGRFAKIGIPAPQFTGPFVGCMEIVCGATLIAGFYTTLAIVPLLIVILIAIATTTVPMPPNNTAGTVPNRAAVTPLSKPPSWFDALMKRKFTAPTRPRISSGVAVGLLMNKVPPQYPDGAKQARIQGQVVLRAEIDKDGNIEKLTTVSGDPLLAPAALEAVKQWKYKPYLLNGQPVNVETEVIVNFTLSRF